MFFEEALCPDACIAIEVDGAHITVLFLSREEGDARRSHTWKRATT